MRKIMAHTRVRAHKYTYTYKSQRKSVKEEFLTKVSVVIQKKDRKQFKTIESINRGPTIFFKETYREWCDYDTIRSIQKIRLKRGKSAIQ